MDENQLPSGEMELPEEEEVGMADIAPSVRKKFAMKSLPRRRMPAGTTIHTTPAMKTPSSAI